MSGDLLEDGANMVGARVFYFGHYWTVIGKNYLGDWDVERFEDRKDGRFRIESSIAPEILPYDHPHFVEVISMPPQTKESP